MSKPTILVTGCGGIPTQNVVRSLNYTGNKYKIIGIDCDKYYINVTEGIEKKYLGPLASDPNYIQVLNNIIQRENVDFVHAQPDVEVGVISENREKVKARTYLPSKEVVNLCHNKFELIKQLRKNGIAVAENYLINDTSDLEEAFSNLEGKIWLRAIRGAAGRGSLPVKNINEGKMWIDYWDGWGAFVAEEFLPGRNLAWQGVYFEGELVGSIAWERIKYIIPNVSPSGITGTPSVAKIVNDTHIHELGQKTVEKIDSNPIGIYGVDMKGNKDGISCVTEINPGRFFTPTYMYTKAGYNLVQMYFDILFDLANPYDYPVRPKFSENLYWFRAIDVVPVLKNVSSFPNIGEKNE